jgi:hypothetical protein
MVLDYCTILDSSGATGPPVLTAILVGRTHASAPAHERGLMQDLPLRIRLSKLGKGCIFYVPRRRGPACGLWVNALNCMGIPENCESWPSSCITPGAGIARRRHRRESVKIRWSRRAWRRRCLPAQAGSQNPWTGEEAAAPMSGRGESERTVSRERRGRRYSGPRRRA